MLREKQIEILMKIYKDFVIVLNLPLELGQVYFLFLFQTVLAFRLASSLSYLTPTLMFCFLWLREKKEKEKRNERLTK